MVARALRSFTKIELQLNVTFNCIDSGLCNYRYYCRTGREKCEFKLITVRMDAEIGGKKLVRELVELVR